MNDKSETTFLDRNNNLSLRKKYDILKSDCLKSYTRATTIKEANLWAKDNINIEHIDYSGFNIEFANMFNVELYVFQQLFPVAISKINYVCRMDSLLKNRQYIIDSRNDNKSFWVDELKKIKLRKSLDNGVKLRCNLKTTKIEKGLKFVRYIPESLFNAYIDIGVIISVLINNLSTRAIVIQKGDYSGIYISPLFAKDRLYAKLDYSLFDILEKGLKETNNIMGVLHHEIGHVVFAGINEENKQTILAPIRGMYNSKTIQLGLRALLSLTELEAEAFRNYFGSQNPIPIARDIVSATQQAIEMTSISNKLAVKRNPARINFIYSDSGRCIA